MSKQTPAHIHFSTAQINHADPSGDVQLWELPVVTIEQPGVGRLAVTLDSLPPSLYQSEHLADIDLNKIVDYLQTNENSPWVARFGKSFELAHMPEVDVDTLTNRVYRPDEFTPAPDYEEPLYIQPTLLQGVGETRSLLGFLVTQNSEQSDVQSNFHTFIPFKKLSTCKTDDSLTIDDKTKIQRWKGLLKDEEHTISILMGKSPELRNFVEFQSCKKEHNNNLYFNDKPMSSEQIDLSLTYLQTQVRAKLEKKINHEEKLDIDGPKL